MGDEFKCKASPEEHYYGYAGAFRWGTGVLRGLLQRPKDSFTFLRPWQ